MAPHTEAADVVGDVDVAKVLDATNVHCKVQCLADGAILNARYSQSIQASYVKVRPCHLVLVRRSRKRPGSAEVVQRLASVTTVLAREGKTVTVDTGYGHPASKRVATVHFRDARPSEDGLRPIEPGVQVVSMPAADRDGCTVVIDTAVDGLPMHPQRVRVELLAVAPGGQPIAATTPADERVERRQANPFLSTRERAAWGPGTLEMALPLVEAAGIRPGMRVLEVGGGSGQVAAILARHWDVSVVALEPWEGGGRIQARAATEGVGERVLGLKLRAQDLGIFADATFDVVISIGSFEMIGDERGAALAEMVRVAKPGAHVGIAEPMCLPGPVPADVLELDRRHKHGMWSEYFFRTLDWNSDLFERHGLCVTRRLYFPDAYTWWLDYAAEGKVSPEEQELVRADRGRWLSLGLLVGQKAPSSPASPGAAS